MILLNQANYPNITPAIAQRVKWRDTAAGPWTGSTGTKNYNGNEVYVYMFLLNTLSVEQTKVLGALHRWCFGSSKYFHPSTSGLYYRRLWLKSPTIVLDGNIQITGNPNSTSSAIQIKTITGSLWQAVSVGNLTVNGELGVSGSITGANFFLTNGGLYTDAGDIQVLASGGNTQGLLLKES